MEFRQELALNALIWEYDGDALFMDTVRPHLTKVIGRFIREDGSSSTKTRKKRTVAPPLLDLPMTVGRTVKLIEIGPQDACYGQRAKYLGHTGIVIEAEQQDGWLRGTFRFDTPLFHGDNGILFFPSVSSRAPGVRSAVSHLCDPIVVR